MISGLMFVSANEIFNSFEMLTQECGNDEQSIIDYFESSYIGKVR